MQMIIIHTLLIALEVLGMAIANKELNVIRIERVGGAFSKNFKQSIIPAQNRMLNVVSKSAAAIANEPFNVVMECPGVSTTSCENARKSLVRAGEKIARVLRITNTITIKAQFYSFGSSRSNTLGAASYGTAFVAEENNQYYLYNQALLKQLNTNVDLPEGGVDIVAEFNSDISWYFGDSSRSITAAQTDFEWVAAHEITHGLGFGSGLVDYGQFIQGAKKGYLATLVTTGTSKMEPIDVYDSFLQGGSTDFKEVGKEMASFEKKDSSKSLVAEFESSGKPFEAAKRAYVAASKGPASLYFNSFNGMKIELYSPAVFSQGSSLHHLATKNTATADFLMIPALDSGITLESLMARSKSDSIYGPQTTAVMQSIGWPTADLPDAPPVKLVSTGAAFKQMIPSTLLCVILFIWILELF
jgi:hypothetical protein